MKGDLLDLVLLAVSVLFAVSGYRQGFIVGVLSVAGFAGGVVLGALYAPALANALNLKLNHAVFGIIVAFATGAVGQVLLAAVAVQIRRRVVWRSARTVDAVGGAAVSVLSVLLIAWLIGSLVANSSLVALSRQVRHSRIITAIDDIMPNNAATWFAAFRRLVERSGFPQVFGALGPPTIASVPPPDPRVANSFAVRADERSIVKVVGVAPSCSRQLEGSGFVFAPDHVMTNAHVVAGVRNPHVVNHDGSVTLAATVVLYDPHRDVAVLYVPGLTVPTLRFTGPAAAGASAIVAGYPENGPFTPVAARVRGEESAQGPDIYQSSIVVRQIYAVRAVVRPGNSGGPLLAVNGGVYGLVFAAASDNPDTGYALTAAEVGSDARAGASAQRPVSTDGCD